MMVPGDGAALVVAGPCCEVDSDRGALLVLEVDISRGLPRLRTETPSPSPLTPPLPRVTDAPSPRCSSGRYTSARRSLGRCHSPSLLLPLLPFFILLAPLPFPLHPLPRPPSLRLPRRIQHAFPTLLRGTGNGRTSLFSYHFVGGLPPSLGSAPESLRDARLVIRTSGLLFRHPNGVSVFAKIRSLSAETHKVGASP